eukprot:7861015-Pyramimonas_sp.AAC.1
MICCAALCDATQGYAMMCYVMLKLSEAKMEISNAKLRGRKWGNHGADPGGTARGVFHCAAPLRP